MLPRMYSVKRLIYVLSALFLGLVIAESEPNAYDPELVALTKWKHGVRAYHGQVREDAKPGTVVSLDPPLAAKDKDKEGGASFICGYKLYKYHSSDLPFRVELLDRKTGKAQLLVRKDRKLNFETKERYGFEIAAYDCGSPARHSKREKVHIRVEDVNEFAPVWEQESYIVEVLEGRTFDRIMQLKAIDKDGSLQYSNICHFHVLTPYVPFKVDSTGTLKNTEPLDYSKKRNYILEVKAEDCGGDKSRTSAKVMVNVKVKEMCKPGWKGVKSHIEYVPGSDRKLIGGEAHLETCEPTCNETEVSTTIHLTTKHIGKGCDRDTYSIQSQRKLCGASAGSVDLLPSPSLSAWTKHLPTDDGHESDQIYAFDGKTNAVEVPTATLNHSLNDHFTISTWMKHEENPEDTSKHGMKEHIMCNSDGERMNRHHYSLFVHNCRLVFLLRQEAHGRDLNTFKPAEWRWKMPQVCDGQWHHYAVSVDFPQVRLYVDGKLFVTTKDNPEIIDDWPLHRTRKIHFTKLVVGACWQGGEKHLSQYFHGYLAGLSVLRGKTESDRVIRCLNNCKEKLDFHAMNEMDAGMSVAFNSEMTEITITGKTRAQVERLVRRVGYINSRTFPTPGHRQLRLDSNVKCKDMTKVDIPAQTSLILVQQAEKPIISIMGTPQLAFSEHEVIRGQELFPDVNIISRTRMEEEESKEASKKKAKDISYKLFSGKGQMSKTHVKTNSLNENDQRYKLDSCIVHTSPPMVLKEEHLTYPYNLAEQMGLEITKGDTGLVIAGADKVANYEEVLHHIHYVNRRPDAYNTRLFTLTCSELNGRFVSSEFKVKVGIVHKYHAAPSKNQAANIQETKVHMAVKPAQQMTGDLQLDKKTDEFIAGGAHSGAGVGMTVIIVVCVGFLIFMIVLGVIRIRAAHQRAQVVAVEEKQEMEWDNSALTITVNPMDQEVNTEFEDPELRALRGEDSDSDDDDASSYHDELESSEEEAEKVKDRDLEWDDSTLSF